MGVHELTKGIETAFDGVVTALADTDEDLLDVVPFQGSWTIGQVAEHIAICSGGIPDGRTAPCDRPYDGNVSTLRDIFADMEQKAEAAPAVYPKGTVHEKPLLVAQLARNRQRLLDISAGTDLTQLCVDMEFPFLGYMTRYEWLFFMSVHTQRHLRQIRNIQRHLAANLS